MTDRILPHEEWGRLAHTPLGSVVHGLDPRTTAVVVVENEAGEIIGCWGTFWMLHSGGLWVAEAHRRRGGVMRRLLRGLGDAIHRWGCRSVIASAAQPEIENYLTRLGAVPVPAKEFFLCPSS